VRYKRWSPKLGWDHRATEISDPSDLTTSNIELMPTSSGNVTVTWIGYDEFGPRLRERVRALDGSLVTDAPRPDLPGPVALAALANPIRAGQPLEFRGDALASGAVLDLLDASGRHVARAVADAAGRARFRIEETRLLPAGLYFASVRGGPARGRVVVLR
jgi:hypothetical protein